MTFDTKELESLDYKCQTCGDNECIIKDAAFHVGRSISPAIMGFNNAVIKPKMRVNNKEVAEQILEQANKLEPPIKTGVAAPEYPEMDKNTRLIVNACKQVVQSAEDYDTDTMTTPITVVQACEQLSHLITRIRKAAKAKEQREADNAMTEGF